MKDTARVVVIGGGVIGCSVLYYLTRMGWTDVVLLEKNELTAGATWHAAANTLLSDDSPALNRINMLSQKLYRAFEQEEDESVGFHKAGCLRVARTPQMLERLKAKQRIAHYTGIDYEILGREGLGERNPLLNLDKYIGASWAPDEGYMDPSLATHAFARAARARGAQIFRHTKVESLAQRPSGEWLLITDKGEIAAEHVIICTGMWAPELTRSLGYELPMVTIERQYLVMEDLPEEYQNLGFEIPLTHDFAAPFYVRQFGRGLVVGVHDQHTVYCFENGIPPTFGQELFPIDLDRVSISLNEALSSVPVLERMGVRSEVCGPTSRTPDLNGMLGPLAGFRNLHVAVAWASGITQGAAIGFLAAEWIVEGEPSLDTSPIDVSRFGPYANKRYVRAVLEKGHNFGTTDTNTAAERQAGRPGRVGPLYHAHKAKGAHFGVRLGWEVPLWFPDNADAGAEGDAQEWSAIANEARRLLGGVGLCDLTGLAKFEVAGPGAAAWLERLSSGGLPETGAAATAAFLNHRGAIAAVVTIGRIARDSFFLTAPGRMERRCHAWLSQALPPGGSVELRNVSASSAALLVAGAKALELAATLSGSDFSTPDRIVETEVAFTAARVLVRETYGFPMLEVHMPAEYLVGIHERFHAFGRELDVFDFGLAALDVHRLQAGLPEWGTDFGPASLPEEAGLAPRASGQAANELIAAPEELGFFCGAPGSVSARAGDFLYSGGRPVAIVRSTGPNLSDGRPMAFASVLKSAPASGQGFAWVTRAGTITAERMVI